MLQQTLFPVIFLALICHAFAEESCPHFREDTGCPCATKYAEPGVKYYSKAQSKFLALARCQPWPGFDFVRLSLRLSLG